MKKQVLIGTALLAAISAYPQNGRTKARPVGYTKSVAGAVAGAYQSEETPTSVNKKASGPVSDLSSSTQERSESTSVLPPSTLSWSLLCGSMNINGMLVSNSRPLQYNDELNAVSFIHRKSASYQSSPVIAANAQSGIIVAEISSNGGATFDSTCISADATNWGRYPQGGIYNPVGNTSIANAYVVGMGPTTPVSAGWTGNFYASKQLNAFNNSPSTATNAQQFLSSGLASYPANLGPSAFSRYGFSATDDGKVRSLALIMNDASALTGIRGFSIVKGTFNSGVFVWTSDSIIPATTVKSDGTKNLSTNPHMAWNESGTIGYVVSLGSAAGSTSANIGYQPIIYKTTNSGGSWALVPGIDFNSAAMAPLLNSVAGVTTNSNLAVPQIDSYGMVVDANGKLHIGATYESTYSSNLDSLAYSSGFTVSINPGDTYNWLHVPGVRPYLYDFIGDGTSAWTAHMIDSLATEGMGTQTAAEGGFNDNPWAASAPAPAVKADDIGSRVQVSRTPDGQYITFTFAESDTNFTNGAKKYNNLPNIKARCMAISAASVPYQVSPTEINATKVAAGTGTANANVANRAMLHYLSAKTGSAAITPTTAGGFVADILTPMTVTNSNPLDPVVNNSTYYQKGKLSYQFPVIVTGMSTHANSASNSMIYPNPASNNAVLAIELKENANVDLTVLNTVGQVVKTAKAAGQVGQNAINIDLAGLSTGIYMVNVKVGNVTSTKKLVVQ